MPELSQYWAKEEPDSLAPIIMERWQSWRQYYVECGLAERAVNGRRYYYGINRLFESSSRLQLGGKEGEFLKTVVNTIRPIVQRALSMIQGRAPVMQPVSANSDSEAREQAVSAMGILQHEHRRLDTDSIDSEVLEIAMCMGMGARLIIWDANAGDPEAIDPDTDQPVDLAGDFANHILTPFDIAVDATLRGWRKMTWIICRTWENKWDLAARYPDKESEILSASPIDTVGLDGESWDLRSFMAPHRNDGDQIPVYHFFHVSNRAIPKGRWMAGRGSQTGPTPTTGCPLSDAPQVP